MKARSRLKSAAPISPHFYSDEAVTAERAELKPKLAHHHPEPTTLHIAWPDWLERLVIWIPWHQYLQHLFTLILALAGYGGLIYFVTHIDPDQIANLGLPHLYLPFQLLFLVSNIFLFSFLLLHSRRGLWVALWLQIILFLKLQLILITWQLGLMFLIAFVIIEGLSTWFDHRSSPNHANVQQATFHRRRRTHS